jgi:2-polyprenyl-6-methoxyphenol hydroxylase-like FAD-dependent oxidoreductase
VKAIICGAGIAGLTMAWWLSHDGWDVTLLERTERLRGEGYMIDFFGSGWDVAERMGLVPQLRALRYPVTELRWINRDGKTVATMNVGQIAEVLQGRYATVLRGDLERMLFDALPKTVELRFGTTIDRLGASEIGVLVRFTSGEIEKADLLIGADGIHSAVREEVFGPERRFIRPTGHHTAAFIFENPALAASLGQDFRLLSVPGREVGFYPLRDGRIASFFVHRTRRRDPPDNPVEELRRVYGSLGWLVPASLEAAARLPSIYYDLVAQVEIAPWSKRRVVLIGDACMAVSLLAGQGASMGMASAYCLAEALRNEASIEIALAEYERRLKKPIQQKQRAGLRTADWLVPPTRMHLFIRNVLMAMAARPFAQRLLAKMFLSGAESVIAG